jgi:hypothetical protein
MPMEPSDISIWFDVWDDRKIYYGIEEYHSSAESEMKQKVRMTHCERGMGWDGT